MVASLRIRLVFLSFVAFVALLVAGYVLPGRSISNGMNDFEGVDRVRAEWALSFTTGKDFDDEFSPAPRA